MEDQQKEVILDLKPNDIKDILIYSKGVKNVRVTIVVPPSRFRKILSDHYTMNGVSIDGIIDRICTTYSSYILSKLDDTGNVFNIVKGDVDKEVYGKCNGCNCGATNRKGRWINRETGKCFYQDMTTRNYTTKLK